MQNGANIIYRRKTKVEGDTQSAFKMTFYTGKSDEDLIYCYMKAYAEEDDLILRGYLFEARLTGKNSLCLYVNLCPEDKDSILALRFSFRGIEKASFRGKNADRAKFAGLYTSEKADDEQGYYWYGQIRLPGDIIREMWGTKLSEKSVIALNMTRNFESGNTGILFLQNTEGDYKPEENMGIFTVLDY